MVDNILSLNQPFNIEPFARQVPLVYLKHTPNFFSGFKLNSNLIKRSQDLFAFVTKYQLGLGCKNWRCIKHLYLFFKRNFQSISTLTSWTSIITKPNTCRRCRQWLMLISNSYLKGHSPENNFYIITFNDGLGPNWGTRTLFKFLKSPVALLRFFKRGDSLCKMGSAD
jgi:hypothetical protein